MRFIKRLLAGIVIGTINIFFGAGGGMITVPIYKHFGMEQKQAQIHAVATILPITIVSSIIYLINGNVNLSDSYIYLIPGLIGSIAGTFLIKKVSNKKLTIIFAIFMVWAGVRLLIKWIYQFK